LLNTLLQVDVKGKDSKSAYFSRENTRFNAVDLAFFINRFHVCMFEHLCETFKLSASCICGRISISDEEGK
jgi:hypothetical protein